MYEEFLMGHRTGRRGGADVWVAPSETIMLKVVKYAVGDDGSKTVLQNYYFPNISKYKDPEGE
jgi:hypothetical protein